MAASAGQPNYAIVYLLFIVAGLLVGGAWSAYKAENKKMTYVMGLAAAIAVTAAVLWLIGEMT
ncbi:hypothetical protein [Corynebacterium sp. H128]|uniref:hypothetical protein n=1 Tax=Corynebacterium sp. H128 TaxID=3133427 RepID=UPI0030D7BCD2